MPGAVEGKLAVVTGATSGIGAAIAHRLAAEGATVIGVGRRGDAPAIEGAGGNGQVTAVCGDLGDPRDRAQVIGEIEQRAPRIDILVNNAGEAAHASPLEVGAAGWRALFETNLHAAIELAVELAPRIAPGGHLINVSSVAARFAPGARFAAHAATRAALDRATEALRLELDLLGVHVTSIAPGLVGLPADDPKLRHAPRWLSPGDVGDAVLWVVTRPAHVVISELLMLPAGQGR